MRSIKCILLTGLLFFIITACQTLEGFGDGMTNVSNSIESSIDTAIGGD